MSTAILIPGLTPDDKVPGAYRETKYGQGKVSIGSIPIFLTLLGNKLAAGTAVENSDVLNVFSEDDADTFFGAGGELARMAYAALAIPGVNLRAIAVPEAGGAAAGTMTVTIGGSWTTGGQFALRFGGKFFRISVSETDTTTTVATKVRDAINGDARLFCSATAAAAVATVTTKSKGLRQNDWIVFKDLTGAPAGITVTLGGAGSSVTGGGKKFGSGSGTDDVTTALTLMDSVLHDYIAPAQNDAVNADLVRDQVNSKAGPLIGMLQHIIFGHHSTQTNATSLAQTTLNEQRCQVVWYENCESHPAEIAAQWAAIRATTEGTNPNPDYDDVILPTIAPQSQPADFAKHSALKAALNNGLTPLKQINGKVAMVRAITTHSLNGASPDYRTLDVGDAKVPDRISEELGVLWAQFKADNPYVGPDPDIEGGEAQPPEGVGTPSSWTSIVLTAMREFEALNWVQEVDANPPQSEFDDSADRIMSAVPVLVRKVNHQIGISVRQQAA